MAGTDSEKKKVYVLIVAVIIALALAVFRFGPKFSTAGGESTDPANNAGAVSFTNLQTEAARKLLGSRNVTNLDTPARDIFAPPRATGSAASGAATSEPPRIVTAVTPTNQPPLMAPPKVVFKGTWRIRGVLSALINGKEYRVGDTVEDYYKVAEIGNNRVVLRAGDQELVLKPESPDGR